ncbi:hypothetical protein BOO69_05570 [Sulfitobacter alexandrii]|uniref:Uncharacterized protein n=1 Tax=Sulfitobacter alexandrii TaxID=1917485 RepID=A0A1J0WFP7_9RHOB|nr:hypothetical protein BOO69_05570 [Sulfitobacter alexandrii]
MTTARFDPGIYGFHRAHRHFFPEEPEIDRAVSFILVERLGNIRSLFLAERIRQLLERLVSEGLMSVDDVKRVGLLYEQLINAQKIINNTTITPSDIVACFAKA